MGLETFVFPLTKNTSISLVLVLVPAPVLVPGACARACACAYIVPVHTYEITAQAQEEEVEKRSIFLCLCFGRLSSHVLFLACVVCVNQPFKGWFILWCMPLVHLLTLLVMIVFYQDSESKRTVVTSELKEHRNG